MTSQPTRSDPERHQEQVRAANRARHRAVKRLRERHLVEWEALYAEEAKKEGVEAKPTVVPQVNQMARQIEELTAQVTELRASTRKTPAARKSGRKVS